MVSPNKDIVFIDFEDTGGTSGYIAPEIMYNKYDESIYTKAVDIWSLGMTMLNVYIDDYTNELYNISNLKYNIKMKYHIDLDKNINIMLIHSSSDNIDTRMAQLFIKILRVNPSNRISIMNIINELKDILNDIELL
tara:strand:- start:60 stop:467 length:408 start_codon:yes stop_codon:yes gene_type:complete